MVLEELFAKTVFANFITDLSPYAQNGGDIFHIPNVYTNAFSVQTQSTQGTEVTLDSPTQVDVTLTVDTHKYIAHLLGDLTAQQLSGSYDMNAVYARKAGGTLADALEDSIAALWSGLTGNTASGDTATVLTDLEVRTAIGTLEALNFDSRNMAFFFHPTVWFLQVLGIQKYYDVSQRGWTASSTISGNFGPMDASRGLKGELYGIPAYVTSNVVSGLLTYRNLLLERTCLGFALQTPGGGKVRVRTSEMLENLGTLTVTDIIYGVAELRDSAGIVVNANTTATTS